jgi:hypothetical protein
MNLVEGALRKDLRVERTKDGADPPVAPAEGRDKRHQRQGIAHGVETDEQDGRRT